MSWRLSPDIQTNGPPAKINIPRNIKTNGPPAKIDTPRNIQTNGPPAKIDTPRNKQLHNDVLECRANFRPTFRQQSSRENRDTAK